MGTLKVIERVWILFQMLWEATGGIASVHNFNKLLMTATWGLVWTWWESGNPMHLFRCKAMVAGTRRQQWGQKGKHRSKLCFRTRIKRTASWISVFSRYRSKIQFIKITWDTHWTYRLLGHILGQMNHYLWVHIFLKLLKCLCPKWELLCSLSSGYQWKGVDD